MSLCFMVLLLQLWTLQILQSEYYRGKAERNYLRRVAVPALRGRIFDRRGELLADNLPAYELIMNYLSLSSAQKQRNLEKISGFLQLSLDDLRNRFSSRSYDQFGDKILLRNMDFSQVVAIAENLANLPGVQLRSRPQRVYPLGALGSHLLGHIGEVGLSDLVVLSDQGYEPGDDLGKTGLEKEYESSLRGRKGMRTVQVSSIGLRKADTRNAKPSLPGSDLHLTLDASLQASVEELLAASAGVVIVLNPNNGEILAMASSPGFDPNTFTDPIEPEAWNAIQANPLHPLQNRAVAGLYPPGSVFKLAVAWAGLREGVISPNTTFNCSGALHLGKWRFRCHQRYGHGRVNLHGGVKYSCDVYFYELGRLLGIETIARYARLFGMGGVTGIDLPEERSGLVPDKQWKRRVRAEPWYPGNTLHVSIGQGDVLVTPLQVAAFYGALANGGRLYRPHLVRRVTDYTGRNLEQFEQAARLDPIRTVSLDASKWERLVEALSAVVNGEMGTGRRAKLEHVEVCGKTGTAEAPPKEPHAWFAAFAPRDNPSAVVMVLIENGGHGGEIAAPIAREVLLKLFPPENDTLERVS